MVLTKNKQNAPNCLSLIRKGANNVEGFLNTTEPYDVDLVSMDIRMNYLKLPLIYHLNKLL